MSSTTSPRLLRRAAFAVSFSLASSGALAACGGSPTNPSAPPDVVPDGSTPLDASRPDATRSPDAALPDAPPPDASAPGADADDADADAAPPTIATPNEVAGTRLKPQYVQYDFSDGAEWLTFDDFLDTQRNETCSPQTLSDAAWHCAPYGERMLIDPSTYFADAACTSQPVIGTNRRLGAQQCDGSITPPSANRYFALPNSDECAPVSLIPFPTTAPLAVDTIYQKTASGCSPVSVSATSEYTWEIYASPPLPLAEVPPSSFVGFTRTDTTPVAATRLRAATTVYTGEDGSSLTLPGQVVDSQRDEFCSPITASDGTSRCLPASGPIYPSPAGGYSDPGCSQPNILVANNPTCTNDARYTFFSYMYQYVTNAASCMTETLYPRPTDALGTIYYGTPSSCSSESVSQQTDFSYYPGPTLPAPLSPSLFSDLKSAFLDSPNYDYGKFGTRIQFKSYGSTSADGFSIAEGLLPWDTSSNGACFPATLTDGNLHCLPESTAYLDSPSEDQQLFADAACTEGVLGANLSAYACSSAPTLWVEATTSGSCYAYRLFQLPSTPLSNPTLYSLVNGTCTKYTGTSPDSFYLQSAATEVQPSAFVSVTSSLVTAP